MKYVRISKRIEHNLSRDKISFRSFVTALRPYMRDKQADLLIDRITSMLAHRPELGKTFLQSDVEELVQKVNEFLKFKNSN